MGYGRRWAVETAFSTYKRLYGENTMSRNMEKHSKRAEGQKHTIQHANKHVGSIITDKQKKKIEREI
jgi:hypothetical protein